MYCLDGVVLIFFILAYAVLCFRSVGKPVLKIQQYFSCCLTPLAQHWVLDFCLPASKLGLGESLWREELGQLNQMDTPCHNVMLSQKLRGSFSKVALLCILHGKWTSVCWCNVVGDCLCIIWFWGIFLFLLHLLKHVYLNPWVSLPNSLIHRAGRKGEATGWVLTCWLESAQNNQNYCNYH